MRQIHLTDQEALDYATAVGDLSASKFNLSETVKRLLAVHGVDPATPHQIDGTVLTVMEAPNA